MRFTKRHFITLARLLVVVSGLLAAQGCHTAHGFGEDVESAGKGIQEGTQ